jgi:hypothetical protein
MKLALSVLFICSIAAAQITPVPACATPQKQGLVTIQCIYVLLPKMGQYNHDELMIYMAAEPGVAGILRITARLADNSGATVWRSAEIDAKFISRQLLPAAILYIPARPLRLVSLEVVRLFGDFAN